MDNFNNSMQKIFMDSMKSNLLKVIMISYQDISIKYKTHVKVLIIQHGHIKK
jgi:hypothetical protein